MVERVIAVIFWQNGVKLYPFHFIKGYTRTLQKYHRIYLTFSGLLHDAVLMISNDDIERERERDNNWKTNYLTIQNHQAIKTVTIP
jgi:hypothetical protein